MMNKSEARKIAKQRRAEACLQPRLAATAQAHLRQALRDHSRGVLASYMPLAQELDPNPALSDYRGGLCLPVVVAKAQPLMFRHWGVDVPLIEGAFKALIPETGDWVVPQIVIVPLLGFDERGYRLGYGGGFYDRSLEVLRAQGQVIAIGFAYEAQCLSDLPIEPTDQRLDMIVTETGIRQF